MTSRRDRALAALLTESTTAAAATAAGVPLRTLARWLADPDFAADLRSQSRQALDGTVARLRGASTRALDTLTALLAAEAEAVRARAAVAILDLAYRVDTDELAARLDEIERAVEAATKAA